MDLAGLAVNFKSISLDRKLSGSWAAIADVKDGKNASALFSVDTNYGRWQRSTSTNGTSGLCQNEHEISYKPCQWHS